MLKYNDKNEFYVCRQMDTHTYKTHTYKCTHTQMYTHTNTHTHTQTCTHIQCRGMHTDTKSLESCASPEKADKRGRGGTQTLFFRPQIFFVNFPDTE